MKNCIFSLPIICLCRLIPEDRKSGKQKILWSGSLLLVSFSFLFAKADAQIIPDGTLPANSIVTPLSNPSGRSFVIEGGTRAGRNLFHSFQEFSVPSGGEAFFNNPLDIQSIFSRVTGRSISHIDGLIRTLGTANLFLLNPNGIIFGPNAQLNLGGSFLASTANSIKFADGTEFSTANPQTTPLLTISVPVGLQMGLNPGNIVVQGPGHNLSYDSETGLLDRSNRPVGLQVIPGQTLALLGGNLALEGGNLTAAGGRVELGSVGGATFVTLTATNQGLALSYPDIQNFQDISFSKAASIDATGVGGGNVFAAGRRITLTDGSVILAFTEGAEAGGTLKVRASETVELIGTSADSLFNSGLFISVTPGATGNGGDLTIETANLRLIDGGQVGAGTFGAGNGGNLTVKATGVVELNGIAANGLSASSLDTSVNSKATGNGGNLTIETNRLRLVNGAQIGAGTFGAGNSGSLIIKATEAVEVIGTSADGKVLSGLFTSAQSGATGNGGNLTIETDRLQVANGAQVFTGTFGSGKAGNLTIKATDSVKVIGTSANSGTSSGLFASTQPEATGNGGNLTIETDRLQVADGAQIVVSTFGAGKAGILTVKATDSVEVMGTSANSGTSSGLFASVARGATGEGGKLTIETARLRVTDGAVISVATSGNGKAGDLIVKATDVIELNGIAANGMVSSGLAASVDRGAAGEGGNLTIDTARLRVVDGAQVSVATFGAGKAGNLIVKATDEVEVIGTSPTDSSFMSSLRASTTSESTGEGGNLTIETTRLRVADGAVVTVRSRGEGKAGNLMVDAGSIRLENSGSLIANTKAGGGSIELRAPSITLRRGSITTNATGGESGGNISVSSQFLQLRDRSNITTNAEGENVIGGGITLNADVIVGLENSDITANSINSQGGNVTINTQAIFGLQTRTREELQSLLNTDDVTLLDPKNLATSDITATGANSSLSGTLAINTLEANPNSGLVDLPANPINNTMLVISNCHRRGGEQSEFIVIGKGGLPPSPNEPIRSEATWIDLREIALSKSNPAPNFSTSYTGEGKAGENQEFSHIVEAQGWMKNSQGQVVLVAKTVRVTPQNFTSTPQYCH